MIAISEWYPADGLKLEPNALRGVKEQTLCLALTAGPGAGKTEMLAQRADFLLRTGSSRYPKRILAISFKADASQNLKERVRQRCGQELASRFDSYTFHAFAKRIIDRFRVLLIDGDALDADYTIGDRKVTRKQIEFSDLIPLAIQILKESQIAKNALRQTYSDIFLDEFQDCTKQQYELVRIAFQGTAIRLTAVGDTKQRIMGWAGALDGIFETFVKDFSAVALNMYRNFRSKPRLLRMQNEIIRVLDPTSVMSEDEFAGDEGEVYVERCDNAQVEAEYLASLIADWLINEQVKLSEIAILVSKQLDLYASNLMAELEARDIPYRNEQHMQDVTVEPAAKLIVDYLLCFYGQREPRAWARLMNQLRRFRDDEVVSSSRQDVQGFIKEERKNIASLELCGQPILECWKLVDRFLEKVGLETLVALSPDYESHTRLKAIVNETKSRIGELLQSEQDIAKALSRFYDDQAVRILTIHKSKGLEFDSVIIMAIENEMFFGDQEANRCAFFVGVSRAKRRLVLTYSDERARPDNYFGRWETTRTVQTEYINYALPFTN